MTTRACRCWLIVLLGVVFLTSCTVPPPVVAVAPPPVVMAAQKPVPPIGPLAIGKEVAQKLINSAPVFADNSAPPITIPAPNAAPTPLPEPVGPKFDWAASENFLILGTDRREGWTSWRTDTIIIVGLDRANSRAAVFSIPRDLYVEIPGYGWGRINQADYMGESREANGGGPKLISRILSDTLGIETQHWARIQMDGFIKFVDAVGGVTINLDCPFSEPIFNLTTNRWDTFELPAGQVTLDGEDAYWFVRLRYRESDIGRSSRQRQFLWALRDQMTSTNLLLRLPELWSAFQDTFSTDLSLFEMIDLARFGISLQPENVRASGLTLYDLQNYTTDAGAQVLVIGNPAHVRAVVDNVWSAPQMADAYNKEIGNKCQQ